MALGDRPHGCEVYGLREVLAWRVSSSFGRPSTRVLALGDCGVWLLLGIVVAWLYWLAVWSVSLGEGLHMLDYGYSPICCRSMSIKDQSES